MELQVVFSRLLCRGLTEDSSRLALSFLASPAGKASEIGNSVQDLK